MKTCTKCGETKEFSEFYKMSTAKDGHQTRCKDCTKERIKKLKESPIMQLEKAVRSSIIIENKILFKKGKRLCCSCKSIISFSSHATVMCKACAKEASTKALRKIGVEKAKEIRKKHYKENKERIKEYREKYYEENKEKLKKRNIGYYKRNKEKIREYNKKYYEENKEKASEYYKEYLKEYFKEDKVKEQKRQYKKENKEKAKEYQRRYYEKNKEKLNEQRRQSRLKLKEAIS